MPEDEYNDEGFKEGPLSPEEQERQDALYEAAIKEREAEATRLFGPPEVRTRKNQEYVFYLAQTYSESVIRGLLIALSGLDYPDCAKGLSEIDLVNTPLGEIIRPFEMWGRDFKIISKEQSAYTVVISLGHGTEGDGGQFVIIHQGDSFHITDEGSVWTY